MKVIGIIVLWLAALPASAEIFLCTGGDIPGSVTLAGYAGCSAVSHYQAGIERPVTIGGTGGGAQPANPDFADISLTRGFDISSNALRAAAISGSPRDWSLHFVSSGCSSQFLEYQRINLSNALVSGFTTAATDIMLPAETLNLAFTAIEYVQTTYDQACQVDSIASFGWDRLTSSPTP